MHRPVSLHLRSCSHHCSRLSVTIVTATGQRATPRQTLVVFIERQVCGQTFLRDFTFACRKMSNILASIFHDVGNLSSLLLGKTAEAKSTTQPIATPVDLASI